MSRDLRVGLMIAGIVGKMKFERAAWIDANIGQAERHSCSVTSRSDAR
jgi:hypothetical protein